MPFGNPEIPGAPVESVEIEPTEQVGIADEDELEHITDPDQRELLRAFGTMTLENEESMRSVFEVVRKQMRAAFPENPEGADREAVRKFKDLYFMESSRSADSLTGLYNRGAYVRRGAEAIKAAREEQTQAAVVRFDLSGLKGINDTYTHYAGDVYIKTVANILKKNLPAGLQNMAARVGGDEFALFLTDTSDSEIQTVIQNIVTAAAQIDIRVVHPRTGEERGIRFRKPYLGIAVWDPASDESFSELDHRADSEQVAYANRVKSQTLGDGQQARSDDPPPLPAVNAEIIRKNLDLSRERLDELLHSEQSAALTLSTATSVHGLDLLKEDTSQGAFEFGENEAA